MNEQMNECALYVAIKRSERENGKYFQPINQTIDKRVKSY